MGEIPVSVITRYNFTHSGKHITRLKVYTEKLDKFHDGHKINSYSDDQLEFNSQLMKWHLDFYSLLVMYYTETSLSCFCNDEVS